MYRGCVSTEDAKKESWKSPSTLTFDVDLGMWCGVMMEEVHRENYSMSVVQRMRIMQVDAADFEGMDTERNTHWECTKDARVRKV